MLKAIMNVNKSYGRIILILSSMLIFSILYLLVPDEDFSGVNNISEMIKREVLKEKIKKDIKSKPGNIETFTDLGTHKYNRVYKLKSDTIEKKVERIESQVDDEYTPENVQKSFFEQYFSRLYFSIITGCLLGYGDVYPTTMRAKCIVMLQSLFTIIVIVS